MMTISFLTIPACSKNTTEFLCSRLGLNNILSFLEFRLLLMTQVSLCSCNFLIVHAVAFSFLSSETLNMTFPGQSDNFIFTNQSLINEKITALSQMEVKASRTCTFSFTRKVLLSMMTWMTESDIWLNWGAIEWLKWNEPWFKNWLMTVIPDNDPLLIRTALSSSTYQFFVI